MFKRLLWLTIGVAFGFGMSFWLVRLFREKVARYSPERVSGDLANAARELGTAFKAAMADGVEAMRDREAELRESLNEPTRTGR